ncbi:hypothetical protein PY365_22190 [Roseiarcaceae bacterium H3SJ34-1]|uniref:hypothetical protein n=1 Tax=Terripilifer ovatus TaxID=3032367 RepID=UPI003AB9A2F4|nr:hypothetical protein [Roseiarcaceae bacterium H3SJ34-1]
MLESTTRRLFKLAFCVLGIAWSVTAIASDRFTIILVGAGEAPTKGDGWTETGSHVYLVDNGASVIWDCRAYFRSNLATNSRNDQVECNRLNLKSTFPLSGDIQIINGIPAQSPQMPNALTRAAVIWQLDKGSGNLQACVYWGGFRSGDGPNWTCFQPKLSL